MSRRVVTSHRADLDIDETVDYYLERLAFEAASNFVSRLEAIKDVLAEHPALGSAAYADDARIPNLLSLAVPRFPFVVLYTDDIDAVRIHRVLNTNRDIFAVLADR